MRFTVQLTTATARHQPDGRRKPGQDSPRVEVGYAAGLDRADSHRSYGPFWPAGSRLRSGSDPAAGDAADLPRSSPRGKDEQAALGSSICTRSQNRPPTSRTWSGDVVLRVDHHLLVRGDAAWRIWPKDPRPRGNPGDRRRLPKGDRARPPAGHSLPRMDRSCGPRRLRPVLRHPGRLSPHRRRDHQAALLQHAFPSNDDRHHRRSADAGAGHRRRPLPQQLVRPRGQFHHS